MTALQTFSAAFWGGMVVLGICLFVSLIRQAAFNQARKRAKYQEESDPWSI